MRNSGYNDVTNLEGPFSAEDVELTVFDSLGFWSRPKGPARHKMALLTFTVILPMVHFVPPAFGALIGGPHLLVEVLAVATIVLAMTYVAMPAVMRIAHRWLFPSPRRR